MQSNKKCPRSADSQVMKKSFYCNSYVDEHFYFIYIFF